MNAIWAGTTSSWNLGSNWSSSTVPTGNASFTGDIVTAVTVSGLTTIKTLQFNSVAPAYSFSITADPGTGFSITGTGIANSSSNAQTLTVSAAGNLYFTSATATTSAGNAFIINNLGEDTTFDATSTAGTANITNNGGLVAGVPSGGTTFLNSSTAATSTITTNSTGFVVFENTSSGGLAKFITNAGGLFDISGLSSVGMTTGSIAGAGAYQLGSKTLTVGGNNLSTGVSGNIVDGGDFGGAGGSLC